MWVARTGTGHRLGHFKYQGSGPWTREEFAVVFYSRQLAIKSGSRLETDSLSANRRDLGSCAVIAVTQNEMPSCQKLLADFIGCSWEGPMARSSLGQKPIQRN